MADDRVTWKLASFMGAVAVVIGSVVWTVAGAVHATPPGMNAFEKAMLTRIGDNTAAVEKLVSEIRISRQEERTRWTAVMNQLR